MIIKTDLTLRIQLQKTNQSTLLLDGWMVPPNFYFIKMLKNPRQNILLLQEAVEFFHSERSFQTLSLLRPSLCNYLLKYLLQLTGTVFVS